MTVGNEVFLLPWASLRREIVVGPVRLTPATDVVRDERVEPPVRGQLARFLKTLVDPESGPSASAAVAWFPARGLKELTHRAAARLQATTDAVLVSVLVRARRRQLTCPDGQWGPPSADRCMAWRWPIVPNHPWFHIATRSGRDTGYELAKIKFTRPFHLGGDEWEPDEELLATLGRILREDKPDLRAQRDRVVRALEWFRFAHSHDPAVSELAQIVMMSTAFEVLLEVPEKSKTEQFCRRVEARVIGPRQVRAKGEDRWGRTQSGTRAYWWAYRYYDLRSRIVHGDHVPAARFVYRSRDSRRVPHAMVADAVFGECLIRRLHEWGLVRHADSAAGIRGSSRTAKLRRRIARYIGGGPLDFRREHEALGWARPRRKSGGAEPVREPSDAGAAGQAPEPSAPPPVDPPPPAP